MFLKATSKLVLHLFIFKKVYRTFFEIIYSISVLGDEVPR